MEETLNLTSPRFLRELLKSFGVEPHKSRGQNFLIDGNVARNIVAALGAEAGDSVVEVGPGAGALSALLVGQQVALLAIEIDRGLVAMLKSIFEPSAGVQIICRDALKVRFDELKEACFGEKNAVKLISNLPYVISGPFMHHLFSQSFPFARAVIMLQKEVALRLMATPGETGYSALSVLASYYCERELLFNVPSSVFWPRPTVSSAVLRLEKKEPLLEKRLEGYFRAMVKGLFGQRRKTILNNLSAYLKTGREDAAFFLNQAGIVHGARPESLKAAQFAKLAGITYNKK